MTPDEWKRIKQIAGDAWNHPARAREAYVLIACAGDEILRAQVMNLLHDMAAGDHVFDGALSESDPRAQGD
jgi:hypothetical protein